MDLRLQKMRGNKKRGEALRGLDKALEEVQSAKNRVARLYGMGHIPQAALVEITTKIEKVEKVMEEHNKEIEGDLVHD